MQRRRYPARKAENPSIQRSKKIAEYYEKYAKRTFDSVSRDHQKDKDLIILLDEQFNIALKNFNLFNQISRELDDAKKTVVRCRHIIENCNRSIKEKKEYDGKGFFLKLISIEPRYDVNNLEKDIQKNTEMFLQAEDKIKKNTEAINCMNIVIDGKQCHPSDLVKMMMSLKKKIYNANLRIDAQIKTLDYLQLKEAQIKERETKAALKVEHYTAYAAAYFEQTRKLAESVKRNLIRQEDILEGCPYCAGPMGDTPHADHIYPVSKGGLSTVRNMVLVCENCNLKKSNHTLREFIIRCQLDRNLIEERLVMLEKDF